MKFKDDIIAVRFEDMHKTAKMIAIEMDNYAKEKYGIELCLTATTSTSAEDKLLGRESDTHRTRRAWDIRTRDLPDELVAELCSVFRKKHGKLGAMVKGVPHLIVYKPHGTGPHLHCQLNRKHSLTEIKYDGVSASG